MKIYLSKALFINRAPIERLELNFEENEIAVLSSINGKGKTTVLSHLEDFLHELARPHFPQEFEGKESKFYRVSSPMYILDAAKPSIVYLRLKIPDGFIDYLDIRGAQTTEEQYHEAVTLDKKIPFSQFQQGLSSDGFAKIFNSAVNKEVVEKLFNKNVLTYFPSYRYESPSYLNDPYKINLNFKNSSRFSGFLANPLEVVTGLPQFANWLMDVVLDLEVNKDALNQALFNNLNLLITQALSSKGYGALRFGIGQRSLGAMRIQVQTSRVDNNQMVTPTIFNLSSGELAVLCLFGEILKQADTNKNNIFLTEISGIILVDEVDKHLHIKLQKEILPKLFALFPNVQFILSSHSPFLGMGLAEELPERSKIIDLDNRGVSVVPTLCELYTEVYHMMVNENNRFKELYDGLENKIKVGTTPLIITEGKTDVQHIKKAKEKLNITDLEICLFNVEGNWGDSELKKLLEYLAKVPQARRIIGIFDRDVASIVNDIENNGSSYKNYGNNVYAFCIPVPEDREGYTNISIEFFYSDDDLKKEYGGKRLYFDNEIFYLASDVKKQSPQKLEVPDDGAEINKKICDKNIGSTDWAYSKAAFANLVEADDEFIEDFDFSRFKTIFERIREVVRLG